jgi:hypothetical protein
VALMSRPRIPIGSYGEIAFIDRAKGKVDEDGFGRSEPRRRRAGSLPTRAGRRTRWPVRPGRRSTSSRSRDGTEGRDERLDLEHRIAPATRFNYAETIPPR